MKSYVDNIVVTDPNGEKSILYPNTKQEAVFGLMERLGKLEALHITETEATTMENSYAGRLEVVEIGGGESEQDKTTGAQLFDANSLLTQSSDNNNPTVAVDGSKVAVTGKGAYAQAVYSVKNPTSLIGQDVVLSLEKVSSSNSGASAALQAMILHTDDTRTYHTVSSSKMVSFSVPNTTKELQVRIVCNNSDTALETANTMTVEGIVLNVGSTVLPWEPYTGGQPAPNPSYPQEIKKTVISEIRTHDGNGNESVITLSQPIELYGIGAVQDAIEGNKVKRRFKAITLTENDGWKLNSSGNAYYCATLDGAIKTNSTIISTHFRKGYWMTMEEGTICLGNSVSGVLGISSLSFSSVDDLKSFLANNEVIAVYALEKETIEELPIADQIALNNIRTFDGVTYIEFVSKIKPTYKGKYGTSEMGGMSLESLLTARNNDMRLTSLEASVVNNI